jgi:CelD/BcsL family acetyltransferase involved in cellulose biosynthesis
VEAAQYHAAAWEDLAARALEPNIFFEPGFALNAARHISRGAEPEFLFCWELTDPEARGRLLGVWPLLSPQSRFSSLARVWRHDLGCSCAPLLDRAAALSVMGRMMLWLRERRSRLTAIETPLLIETNSAYAVIGEHARRAGLPFTVVERRERAALDASQTGVGARDFISSRKRKELQRQYRRLRERGAVAFHEARDGPELLAQIEAFMLLEARGWKGRKGTAFLNNADRATFLRAMSRTLGREGKCRLYWLSLDRNMIAGNIVLLDAGGKACFWKTAYDEDHASLSPGVLLTVDMTDRLLRDKDVVLVDSCAISNHPMIDHLWRGRLRVADAMLAAAPDRPLAFNGLVQRERFRRRLKEKAKAALARIKAPR